MLSIKNLSYSYSRKRSVISDFNFEIAKGSICGLLGKNGVGKSTLIYLLSGLLRPTNGEIRYDEYNPIDRNVKFLEDIFLVSEEFKLPEVSIESYMNINAPFYPKFDKDMFERYLQLMELDDKMNLSKISMGQKKKAYLCFAMACNTSLLLLDEPTNGLDISSKRNFSKAIADCMTDDKIIIISTHQINDIDKILDHVIVMDEKHILLNSSLFDICSKYAFNFTTDVDRANKALAFIEKPGGFNIMERLEDPSQETEVDIETLFEFAIKNNKL